MADTRVVIDVDINTSAAAQGLRDLQQRFNAFTGALNKNNAIQATASRQYADQLMNLVNSGQFFTAEMVRMQTAASRLDKTLAKGQATMGQYFSARFIRNSNAAAQVLSLANARAAALQTQFIATSAAANGMRDAIAVRPYEAFNSALAVSTQKLAIHRAMLMQATTHMINFGKNTQWAGRQLMVGFTVPLTIFGGVAGKVFRELEEQAINFKKVYGDIFTTEEETQEALDAVRELSVEFTKYGIAVKDTMALAGVAAQSGLRNAELMAATTQATRLATLGQMEQAEAMKTIISLQTAFKTSNEGLAESVDFLNIIENQTVLSLQDVAGAIPRVAPVIQGLGGDVKDLAVLLVAMKEGGVTAGEGANALKSSLGRLIVPTRQAKEMAAEFGISLEQIVENNRGQLIPMIMELGQALESVGDLERQQLLSTIFGKFQYARIGALFDSITRDSSQAARAMDLMSLSASELGQIAEKELSTVEQSVGARFTQAMEKAKVAIAPLGEAFLQLSIPVINFFTKIIEKFNALPDFAKKFAVFGAVLVGVVIPVGTMFLGLLMNLVGTLIKFGAIVGIAFKGFTSGGIRGAVEAVSQALNYMSLEEIDAANAAQQLGQSTQIVNAALRDQVGDAAAATAAIDALGLQYAELVVRMREAAALSGALGPYAVPGAAMGKAAGAQRAAQAVRRNKGGPIPFSTGDTVPGVGNRDTVPAILTPGEFVVNKKAATENRGLLEAINSGEVRKLNGGGPAIPGRAGAAARIAYTTADQFEEMYLAQRNARIGNANVQDDAQAARRAAQRRLSLSEIDQFDENIERIVAESLAEGKFGTQRTHFTPSKTDTLPTPFDPQSPAAQAWLEENIRGTGQKQLLAREMARYGIPFQRLSDDIIDIPGIINQAARSDTNTPMSLNKAAELSRRFRHMFNIDPRSPSAQTGMSGPELADRLADQLEILARQYPDQLLTDDLLTQARNAAINNQRLNVNPDRYFRIIAKKDLARIAGVPDKIIDARGPNAAKPLNDALNDYFETNNLPFRAEAGSYVRYTGETPSYLPPGTEIRQQFSATPMNAGGIVMDGAQRLFGGGAVLSRAAQLRRVRAAASPFGIEDNALSKVLKLRFNDAKAARGPADFVKTMFSRWETTPTRISPKENTSMLLKGKKLKYKEVAQEDYLADMIVSMDKFSDTIDAFKPIKIGTGFDGGFRVFDGHTRLHAQTVKSLIGKLTGKDTASMSRDELIEGIRLVRSKSLAGELTDGEILRAVSGQRVLSTRAQRREVELLNERPGRAAPMGSMLNREGRILLPGVHDKEISAIVEAAKKANFYGVNKDPDSLMQAMGFISLGGGAKYRYEPGRKILGQPERRSFVRNMSRKIIDDLIDAGEILPLRRNKGGIIPGTQYRNDGGEIFESGGKTIVPGVGRTDTVPAMLTPGEFVVNKDATRKNLDTLKAINNGTVAGFNKGGKVQFLNAGAPVSDWGDFVDPNQERRLSKMERFERSMVGKYAERRLAAGDRAGRLLALSSTMQMEAERSGIFVKELADFEKLPQKQQYKERNLRRAEAAARRYEKAIGIWNAAGRPLPPPEIKDSALRSASGQRTGAAAGSSMSASTTPGGPEATDHIYGYDKNKKPIMNFKTAGEMAFAGQLFDENGKKVPLNNVRLVRRGERFVWSPAENDTPKPRLGMTRAQKIWAIISALTMAGTATGIAYYEKNKNDQFPINQFNKGGGVPDGPMSGQLFESGSRTIVPGIGRRDTVPAALTPGEFVVNKDATRRNIGILNAINNGQAIGLNAGGYSTVIPPLPTTTLPGYTPLPPGPTSPMKVDIAEVSDKDTKDANKKAARGGAMGGKAMLAQMGIGSLLSIPGMFAGQAAGEAIGGENGAMIGAMAGSMLPFMLPYQSIGAKMKGMMGGRGKETVGGRIGKDMLDERPIKAAGNTTVKSMLRASAQFLRLARIIPLLFNPYTALAAAIAGVTYTFVQMHKSNKQEYEAGRQLAKAMSTSAEDIKQLGQTAKQRARNMESYLNATESAAIQEEFATKISEAKTKEEKKRLEQERDAIIKERGTQTRRDSVEKFYKKEIQEAKKRNATEEELRNIYEQRNQSLGVQFQKEADFDFDKTFGAEFIKGAGEKQFKQFEAMRSVSSRVATGEVSRAQAETMTKMADAAYGMSMSFEKIAEKDIASKLSQYILSGTMTQDQAVSVAEAIGAELNDLQIGANIRKELTGIVGVEGGRVKYSPGLVATQLAEQNEKRIEELRDLTYSRAGSMFTTNPNAARDIASGVLLPSATGLALTGLTQPSRTFDEEKFRQGAPTGFNFFTQFFSGMADEFRRNVGSLIELQTNEIQMLEENIAAVGLNYNDLIAKAHSLAEAERLRLERSRTMTKLQEKLDLARERQMQTFFGSTDRENIGRILEPYIKRLDSVQRQDIRTGESRQRFREIDPLTASNFFPNIGERIVRGADLLFNNIAGGFASLNLLFQNKIQERLPSGMAQLVTNETRSALLKKFEGTELQPQFALFEEIFKRQKGTPELAGILSEILNDEEFANAMLFGLTGALTRVNAAQIAGELDLDSYDRLLTDIEDNILSVLSPLELPMETIEEYAMLLGKLDPQGIMDVNDAFNTLGQNYGLEYQGDAMERFLPLFTQIGDLTSIEMPGLGGKSIIDAIFGDPKTLAILGQNDDAMESIMEFFNFVSELDPELQIGFLEDKTIEEMINAGKNLDKFDPKKFKTSMKEIKSILKGGLGLEGQEIEDGVQEIILGLERLNEIEDPEIKAELNAEISPLVYEMLRLLRDLGNATSVAEAETIFDRVLLLYDEVNEATSAAMDKDKETAKKAKSGSGGTKPDTLGEMLRELRDQISAREKLGNDIYAANEKAKGTFLQLRGQGANQAVIDYLQSLSPEEALRVGGELLRDQRKLNSLMGLMSQNAIVQQKEAARGQKERTKAMRFLANSAVVGQMSAILGSEALDDPEFIEGMMTAAGGKNPNKEQQQFLQAYNARKQAERKYMIAQMPATVAGEAQRNRLNQRAQFELANKGFSQAEIEVGLENDAIRMAIEERINEGKGIGPKITKAIKDLAASQKTPIDQINDSIEEILNVYSEISNILQAGIDKIEEFNIKPLEKELSKLQRQNAEYSESQRRLSRSLSDLQEEENDLKDEQSEQEKSINDFYDSRIDALEKVDKINRNIAAQQENQIDLASALSRGDIAAAAKAAQEMRNQAAEQQREQALENLKNQKEEEVNKFKKAAEEELKNLTIAVNGELLTREQIEGRIEEIDQKIYDNSLKEYELQQKITVEREKQAKIAEAQQKIARASNIVSRLQGLADPNLSRGEREVMLSAIQAEVSIVGGDGASQLLAYLKSNRETLLGGNIADPVFAQGLANSVNTFLDGFAKDFASFISPENFKVSAADFDVDEKIDLSTIPIEVPDISGILNTAFSSASATVQLSLDTLDSQLAEYEKEVITKNPFDTLIGGTRRLKKIAKEFLDMIPKKPGSGGSGPEPDDEVVEPGTGPENDWKIGKPVKVPEQGVRGVKRTYTLKNGLKVIVTRYYDKTTGQPALDENGKPLTVYESQRRTGGPAGFGTETAEVSVSQAVADLRDPQYGYDGRIIPFPSRFVASPGSAPWGAPRTWENQGGAGAPTSAPVDPVTGMPVSNPNAMNPLAAKSLLNRVLRDLREDPNWDADTEALAREITGGITQKIATGEIEGNEKAVREAILRYFKSKGVLDIESPAKSMYPIGGFVASGIIQGVVDWFASPLTFIWEAISSFFKKETGTESGASTKTGIFGENLIQGLFNGLISKIPGYDLWTTISSWITGQINGEGQGDDGTGSNKSKPFGISLAEGLWNGLKTKIPGYGLWTTISSWITGALGIGGEEGAEGSGATKANPAGKSLAEGMWDGLKNWFLNETSIGRLGSSIFGWIASAITGKSEDIEDQGGEGTEENKGIGSLIIDGLTNWAKNTLDLGGFVENMKQKFKDKQAEFEGIGDSIGGWINGKVNSAINAAKSAWEAAKTNFSYFGGPIKRAFGGNINYRPPMTAPPGMMFGGKMKKFAMGSFVPGIGNTDTVPALLTPGEFVVRKSVAQTYGPLLNALNSDVFPKMTMTSLMPSSSKTSSDGQVSYNYAINVNVSGSNASPDDIANTVMSKIKMMESRNIRGTRIG